MDVKFHPAIDAMRAGDVDKLKALVAADPSLVTSRSSKSHATLLQAVVLDGKDKPKNVEMVQILIDAGAELSEPLVAAASIDNRAAAELLLDHGAAIDGTGGWSPLEEALYWNSRNVLALLLERGAKVQNLRTAAALGRTALIESYFNADGSLKSEAGRIDWPFGSLESIACSNHEAAGKQSLTGRVKAWSQDRQGIVDNAFVYACMHGHIDAAKLLLDKGAAINVIPGGFDYAGTGLHYAAMNGHRPMVEFLLAQGADRNVKDTKVGSTAAGWADYGGHPDLRDLLS
ncbi:MAG TPA: ankyrin repeat domain-containing protein [Pyrinomonadaceae bacterium]|nr:ankyrin repeat domain-containing protein [Pyrinomonadaceae bacterium]